MGREKLKVRGGIFSPMQDGCITLQNTKWTANIPFSVLALGELSSCDIQLYAVMLIYKYNPANKGRHYGRRRVYTSHETLAAATGVTASTVKRSLKKLNRLRLVFWNGDMWDKRQMEYLIDRKKKGEPIDEAELARLQLDCVPRHTSREYRIMDDPPPRKDGTATTLYHTRPAARRESKEEERRRRLNTPTILTGQEDIDSYLKNPKRN